MRRVLLCAVTLFALAACARFAKRESVPPSPAADPARLQEFLDSRRDPGVAQDPKIGPGDVIAVDVADVAEASREYTVSRKGAIRLPFAGEAQVAGKSAEEASAVIARALESVVVDPAVVVELVEVAGGEATVEGAVERPGKIRLGMKGKTLLDALAVAGGLRADASGVIRITPGSSAPAGLFAEGAPEGLAEEAIEISTSDVLRGGASGPVRLYLRAGDKVEVVSTQGDALASVGPDPLAELGLPTSEAPLEEESERRPRRHSGESSIRESTAREPSTRKVVVDRPAEVDEPAVVHRPQRILDTEAEPEPVARESSSSTDSEPTALRSDLDALRRRVEANEVDLRNQVRRAEGESSKRQQELTTARADAEHARRQMEAERERAAALTSRIIELEAGRGGPALSTAPGSPQLPASTAVLPGETAEEENRPSGGLFGWFGGKDVEEPPTATAAVGPEPVAEPVAPPPPPSRTLVYAPPPEPRSTAPKPVPPSAPREIVRSAPPPSAPAAAAALTNAPAAAAPPSEPPASVAVSTPARIAVIGRVRSPGNQVLAEGRTATRAVMRAGLADGADVTRIEIQRGQGGETFRIRVNLVEVQTGRSPDVMLEEGDTIVVP